MIYIEPINTIWSPGGSAAYQDFLANEYVMNVYNAIEEEQFKNSWRPLTPGYRKYKASRGLAPYCWEATGQLKNGLRVKSGRVVGFDGRMRHSSGLSYNKLVRKLEYGSGRVPPRPLFRLVLEDMKVNEDYYKRMFEEMML